MSKKVFRHDIHVAMWDWIAKNVEAYKAKNPWCLVSRMKDDFLDLTALPKPRRALQSSCPACDYCLSECMNCPFGNFANHQCLGGTYRDMLNNPTRKTAEVIRDMSLRNDWDWTLID